MIGQTIDIYQILEKGGEGGMGVFYKALDTRLDRIVGLKTLHPELVSDPEFRQKLEREAKSLARLNHPNIVTIFQYLIHDGLHFIVMEYVDGRTLSDVIAEQGPYSFAEAAHLTLQILDAIGYAHKNDVVHRDIKPSNIMVTAEGVVKVTDFGIAKLLDSKQKTRTGQGAGSLFYMSPEQIQHGDIDGRTDIYSLGITLFEMITGTRPFTAESEFSIMKKHLEEQPPAPSHFDSSINRVVDELILHAMQKNPADRFPTADDFAQAIKDTLTFTDTGSRAPVRRRSKDEDKTASMSAKRSGSSSPAPPPSRPFWKWVAYPLLVVLVAVAAYVYWPKGEPEPVRTVNLPIDTVTVADTTPAAIVDNPVVDTPVIDKKPAEDITPPPTEALEIDVDPFNQRSRVTGVWVDGRRVSGSIPFKQTGLSRGRHWVTIETTYGMLTDTVTWAGKDRRLAFFINEAKSRLSVAAKNIEYADIWIDDRKTGHFTPHQIREIVVGPHKVEVKREGYRALGGPRIIRVDPSGSQRVEFDMRPE